MPVSRRNVSILELEGGARKNDVAKRKRGKKKKKKKGRGGEERESGFNPFEAGRGEKWVNP